MVLFFPNKTWDTSLQAQQKRLNTDLRATDEEIISKDT